MPTLIVTALEWIDEDDGTRTLVVTDELGARHEFHNVTLTEVELAIGNVGQSVPLTFAHVPLDCSTRIEHGGEDEEDGEG